MTSPVRAELVVDVGAIRDNVRRLVAHVAPAAVMAVVKADGYGHGMLPAARAAREGGATWLGVATLDEALALRAGGDRGPVLCWLAVPGEDWAAAVAADVEVTASSLEALEEIAAVGGARVQLKVDTGLSRGGVAPADWAAVCARAAALEAEGRLRITGVWSHFATADEPDHPAGDRQERVFAEALDVAEAAGLRPEVRHLANSAGALLRRSAHHDLVRCGIAIYGLDPAPGASPDLGLQPAMTARARVALVKHLDAGESVSYGHTWTAEEPTTVALVPVGYADGVPRHASGVGEVWLGGRRRPIRGRVCMDQFVVDLGEDDASPGDDVILFGTGVDGDPTAAEWAAAIGTIHYEIVTRMTGRWVRSYVDTDHRVGDPA